MHRCLQIYEIQELIVNRITQRPVYQETKIIRLTLLAVLMTCRSFAGFAMKLLWEDLGSLVPLLLAMPEDLIRVEDRLVTFKREVLPSDWERFDFYAPLVKTLGLSSIAFNFSFDHAVEQALLKKGSPLLPNLTDLDSTSKPTIIRQLLAPQIDWLDLKVNPTEGAPAIYDLITSIALRAPALKFFYLSKDDYQFGDYQESEVDAIFQALPALLGNLDLLIFECDLLQLEDAAFEKLVQFPRLRRLGLLFDLPDLADMFERFPLAQKTVPLLDDVVIWTRSDTASHFPQILIALRPFRLETICVQHNEYCGITFTQDDLNRLVFAIESHCSPKFLKSLKLVNIDLDSPTFETPPAIATASLFRPLYAFRNLRELSLLVHPDFTDEEVKELAQSWPLLENLHMEALPAPSPPRTTLRSLLWFAIYCRHLTDLSFSFKGIGVGFSNEELSNASNNPLLFLSVGCSTITEANVTIIIAFLRIFFPNLRNFHWDGADEVNDNMDSKVWRKVWAGSCEYGLHAAKTKSY